MSLYVPNGFADWGELPRSPLSAGTAGGIRGGDRLPRVQTVADDDKFAALTSLAWQVNGNRLVKHRADGRGGGLRAVSLLGLGGPGNGPQLGNATNRHAG